MPKPCVESIQKESLKGLGLLVEIRGVPMCRHSKSKPKVGHWGLSSTLFSKSITEVKGNSFQTNTSC